jgi:hypothetical protein
MSLIEILSCGYGCCDTLMLNRFEVPTGALPRRTVESQGAMCVSGQQFLNKTHPTYLTYHVSFGGLLLDGFV